jgi:hypothetical protein
MLCVMSVTPLGLALISPVAALAGVALGIAGNARLERLREQRAARRGQNQAVAELLTATVDLITGIQAVRAAYQTQTRWRHYIRVGALLISAIGSTMTNDETLSSDLLKWHRASRVLERVLAADRDLDDKQRITALDLATLVGPRTTRFFATVAVLTLGDDKEIADAVRELSNEVGQLLDVIAAKEKKYVQARDRVGKALEAFRAVVERRR